MREECLNEITNEEKNMYKQLFKEYFDYDSLSFLVKDLCESNQSKSDMIVKYLNESLIDLKNSINSKEIPENKNPKKIVNIVEKSLGFNKQQKGKGIKILASKEMLQRLPIALAQVKFGNTSENLLNEMRQILYSLYRAKEITKKEYSNIMDSVKLQNRMDSIFQKF